jgi:hypothetical protein
MIFERLAMPAPSPREVVLLFPTFGHYVEQRDEWRVPLTGAVFEPHVVNLRRRLALRLLRRLMQVTPEALESAVFQRRIGAFLGAGRRRRLVVTAAGLQFRLPVPKRDGLFATTLRIPAGAIDGLLAVPNAWLEFRVTLPVGEERSFSGHAQLLHPEGVSVISDVDDTTKHTEVWSRRALLVNTFLREFQSVEGMAERYQEWSRHGATFHYVTSSPWQLYEPLAELHSRCGFPAGTFHLRTYRAHQQVLRRLLLWPRFAKHQVITRLIRTFPRRKFVLVGDSGEFDPEIYGAIARRFRQQVSAIYIRMVPGRRWSSRRARWAFRRLPDDLWHCFSSAEELPTELPPQWNKK